MGPWMKGPEGAVHADTVEVCRVRTGRVFLVAGAERGWIEAGHVAIIPADVVHSSWTEEDGFEEDVIHLDALAVRAALAGPAPAGVWTAEELGLGEELDARGLMRAVERAAWSARGTLRSNDPRLVRAADAARADLGRGWSVDALAEVAGMSGGHFARSFRAATGQTPMAWLREQRVARAAVLLRQSSRTASEIAYAVGFSSSARLSEAFRRSRGTTPSRWRVDGRARWAPPDAE